MFRKSLIAVAGLCGAVALADDAPARKPYSAIPGQEGILPDSIIESFQAERTDKDVKMRFDGAFTYMAASSDGNKQSFRVTMGLYADKFVGGRTASRRLNGTGHVYVLDSDGRVVARQEMSLAKLCPS